ncbi:MAG: nucleotide exchange factor GrpE [Sphingomonas bacterium]|nr:nucleotide exchange factor GrpE [Sphingomonas bacterium]
MNENEEYYHDEAEAIRAETAAHAPELAEHDRVAELEKALEDAKSKALYAAAEQQNVRRRLDKEMADARTYAAAGFARDMLAIKDHIDRALTAVTAELRADMTAANFLAGIEATARELDSVFTRNGVERVAAKGLPLDPHRHQAMVEIPSNEEPGTVIEEMQAGYVMKDRLLRPALVGVAKKPD